MTEQPYCLPTEAQWEKAARETDGRIYPWGNEPNQANGNIETHVTTPIGTYQRDISPFGVCDMAGHVLEWTSSTFLTYPIVQLMVARTWARELHYILVACLTEPFPRFCAVDLATTRFGGRALQAVLLQISLIGREDTAFDLPDISESLTALSIPAHVVVAYPSRFATVLRQTPSNTCGDCCRLYNPLKTDEVKGHS